MEAAFFYDGVGKDEALEKIELARSAVRSGKIGPLPDLVWLMTPRTWIAIQEMDNGMRTKRSNFKFVYLYGVSPLLSFLSFEVQRRLHLKWSTMNKLVFGGQFWGLMPFWREKLAGGFPLITPLLYGVTTRRDSDVLVSFGLLANWLR